MAWHLQWRLGSSQQIIKLLRVQLSKGCGGRADQLASRRTGRNWNVSFESRLLIFFRSLLKDLDLELDKLYSKAAHLCSSPGQYSSQSGMRSRGEGKGFVGDANGHCSAWSLESFELLCSRSK